MLWYIVSDYRSDCIDGPSEQNDVSDSKRKLKQRQYNELSTECHQLKVPSAEFEELEEIVRKFHESQTKFVLDRIKLIEEQWRKLNLWEIVQSVNPRPIIKFNGEEITQWDETLLEKTKNDIIFRRSSALCCIFNDLMENFGWKYGEGLDIEEDICNVIGQLIMKVDAKDISAILECVRVTIVNVQAHVQAHGSERDELRSLLITEKKYNGSNLACILFEQMILDKKVNNVSWMRIVCAQFIDLCCQLIISVTTEKMYVGL